MFELLIATLIDGAFAAGGGAGLGRPPGDAG